jgi:hypothetical protein
VVRFGLPFSPLVAYHDSHTWQDDPEGVARVNRRQQPYFAKSVSMRIVNENRVDIGWVSWSFALVMLSAGLLVVAGRSGPSRRRAPKNVAAVPAPEEQGITPTPPVAG